MDERRNCIACGGYHGSEGRGIDCLVRALLASRARVSELEVAVTTDRLQTGRQKSPEAA